MAGTTILTIDSNFYCYSYTHTTRTAVVTNATTVFQAATELAAIVPPSKTVAVFIIVLDVNPYDEFNLQLALSRALMSVGYKRTIPFDYSQFVATTGLHESKISCQPGDLVCVERSVPNGSPRIIQIYEREDGSFKFLRIVEDVTKLKLLFLKLTDVVYVSERKLSSGPKRRLTNEYAPFKINFVTHACKTKMGPFLWDIANGANYFGYLTRAVLSHNYYIKYGSNEFMIPFKPDILPMSRTVDLYINDAPDVKVYSEKTLVKVFDFGKNNKKKRNVQITVTHKTDGSSDAILFNITEPEDPKIEAENVDPKKYTSGPKDDCAYVCYAEKSPIFSLTELIRGDKHPMSVDYATYECIAKRLGKKTPKCVLIHFYCLQDSFEVIQKSSIVLKKTGCTVRLRHTYSAVLSGLISLLKLPFETGDTIGTALDKFIFVVRKKESGFELVGLNKGSDYKIFSKYTINLFIIVDRTYEKQILLSANSVQPKVSCLITEGGHEVSHNFYWSIVDNNNFNNCMVDDFTNYQFTVVWKDNEREFQTGYISLPFGLTKEYDIGDAAVVEVYGAQVWNRQVAAKSLLKIFPTRGKKKLVRLTFTIDTVADIAISLINIPDRTKNAQQMQRK